jgi:hypothetical protein
MRGLAVQLMDHAKYLKAAGASRRTGKDGVHCTDVCMYAYIHTHTHAGMSCMHVHVRLACRCIWKKRTCRHDRWQHTHVQMNIPCSSSSQQQYKIACAIRTYAHAHTHTHTHTQTHTHTHACMHACMQMAACAPTEKLCVLEFLLQQSEIDSKVINARNVKGMTALHQV